MESESSLLLQVSVALALALAAGWLATRLGLSTIVGYVVAGLVISPFMPGFGGDVDALRVIADVGIVLLLFTVGVQFSVAELLRAGPRVIAAASLQTLAVLAAGWGLGTLVGLSRDESLYIGAAAAITSSVVAVKLLDERGDTASDHGRLIIAWSIIQDLWAVVLIVILESLTASGDTDAMRDVGIAALKALGFVLAVTVVGLRVVPIVLNRVAEERSRELFFVAIATLVLGTALASEYVGLSLALGAFLAGLVVSESDLSHRVLGELLPTRDVFAVIFFVSAGMLIDPEVLVDGWHIFVISLVLILLAKPLLAWLTMAGFTTPPTRALTAAGLVPAGEFSFLLATSGLDAGGIGDDAFSAILAATAVSIILAPPALQLAYHLTERREPAIQPEGEPSPSRLGRHAVIVGYGRAGQIVAGILGNRFEILVAEEDPRLARQAAQDGFAVIEGNPNSPTIVERMRLHEARLLIITIRDAFTTRNLTERAREINPYLDIVGQAVVASEGSKLLRSGMNTAIIAEDEAAYELARHGLHRFGLSSRESLAIVQHERARTAAE